MIRRKGSWDFRISSLSRIDNDSDRYSEIDSMECFVYVLGSWGRDGAARWPSASFPGTIGRD
jgi:hypothetical protein